jgi:hypothetical protein
MQRDNIADYCKIQVLFQVELLKKTSMGLGLIHLFKAVCVVTRSILLF